MNWTHGFRRALDYLEENMDGDPDYSRAAALAGMGSYQLQLMFSFMTGMTIGEYVRAHRLTLAASDLRRGTKVIDAAMKYGYDSPDSFTRAFSRFHGMPPSEARAPRVRLESCLPLRVKIILEGGMMMDYRIENRSAMKMLGFGFEVLEVPAGAYAVFRTERERYPVDAYCRLREQIAGEWLPGSGCALRNAPELAAYHWTRGADRDKRYIEVYIPVEC